MADEIYQRRYSQTSSTSRPESPVPSFAPPRYSLIFQNDVSEQIGTSTSESESPISTYSFSLSNKGQPWVTLNIQTRRSKTIRKYPRFFGSDNVSGTIDLNLDKPQVINSINLILKGQIATTGTETSSTELWPLTTFLEEHHVVWEKSNSDPQAQTPGFDGKSSGNYQFSFSFPFPDHVDLSSSLRSKGKNIARNSLVCSTPPTILEQGSCANVDYQLILKITHGLLRPDSKLKTTLTYIPRIIPPQPSLLRQNAYIEGTLLPGPARDPDGWVTLPSVVVHGKLEIARFTMDVQCTVSLSLATPLSYPRGTVIPCYMTLSSQNTRALELLADHRVQNVRLARTVQFFEDNVKGLDQFSEGQDPKLFKDVTEVGFAVWWIPPKDVIQDTNMRQLQGEIRLSAELPPSSDFLLSSICYAVQLLPFDAQTFEHTPNLNKDGVLLSYPVVIASVHANGPIATAFTKPSERRRRHLKQDNESVDGYGTGDS